MSSTSSDALKTASIDAEEPTAGTFLFGGSLTIPLKAVGMAPRRCVSISARLAGRSAFDSTKRSIKTSLTKHGFELRASDTTATVTTIPAANASIDPNNSPLVELEFSNITVAPNQYSLFIMPPIKDLFGNVMDTTVDKYKFPIIMPVGGNAPTLAPGITATTGPCVPFGEYNNPRTEANGFNPSDKVVLRVVRLYYFRDAHRVAQIVNRKSRSYNRAAVDVTPQLTDRVARVRTKRRMLVELGTWSGSSRARHARRPTRRAR